MSLKKLSLVSAAFALAITALAGPASSTDCPPPRQYSETCIQVVVWAESPDGELCCQYGTPCSAPAGWQIHYGPNCTDPEIEGL